MLPVAEAQALTLLQWRDRLDERSNKVFSSNHKIVAYRLQVIFVTQQKNERGYYLVFIGKLPKKGNLVGQTGLSDWTIRGVISELCLNQFLKRVLSPGTAEEDYKDTKLYLKPTDLWIPEKFAIIEKSPRHKRIPRCPHCMTVLLPGGYQLICKACGSQFEEPFYTVEMS
jgi:hypothetical protein